MRFALWTWTRRALYIMKAYHGPWPVTLPIKNYKRIQNIRLPVELQQYSASTFRHAAAFFIHLLLLQYLSLVSYKAIMELKTEGMRA